MKTAVDPITAEICRNYLETVSQEMSATVENTAMSPIFTLNHDYSCGVFYTTPRNPPGLRPTPENPQDFPGAAGLDSGAPRDAGWTAAPDLAKAGPDRDGAALASDMPDVQLLARDLAVPVHIFASLESVRMVFRYFRDDIRPGDVFLVADPYMGGTHCPDWTIMKPIFIPTPTDSSGTPGPDRPAFFPCVRGHINDVGGPVPGGYNVNAREVWQEGFRISPVRIVDQGTPVRDLWEVILANTRVPHEVRGDLHAMVGACTVGHRRIEELIRKYGAEAVEASVEYILRYSEVQLRARIHQWPDGTYHHVEYVDHDYAGHRDVPIHVTVAIHGDSLTVDFTGSSGEVEGFINSPPGNSASQVFTAITAMCPDIPVNSGFFRPIRMVLPEASVVKPRPPAPVGHCTLVPGTTIIDAVMKAFEQVVPERVGTAACDLNNARCFGVDSRTGRYFISGDLNATPMSAGGAHGTDGWGAWAATFCALRLPPLEMYELQFPYFYYLAEYATDTAAPGRWRGAPALHFRRRQTDDMRVTIYNGSYRHSLAGYAGGKRGAGNYWLIREGAPDELKVTECCLAEPLPRGSLLFAQSGGGGGWGDPLARDPQEVLDDWLDEVVSLEVAARDYGVVIDPSTRTVDVEKTAALRAQARHARDRSPSSPLMPP
ncbi:MAG: hydantoinase B/oxoprolinase family protein [Armatimonadetes bacterium]|nr:hydantoinase B/oxoprolinase family protein [Armatimonadota bacterium]